MASILCIVQISFTSMKIPAPDDGNLFGNSYMAAMTQVMVSRRIPQKFESPDFEIQLCQKLDHIVSYPWRLAKGTEALLEADDVLEVAT